MSSNSGVVINRSNDTSPFYQALKSRNSKSLPELYSAEVNSEPAAQSVVEVESSSNPGYGRTLRIELPRYGLLNRLYLHSRFSASSGTFSAANYAQQIPFIGAMCIKEARLMYNGQLLQKTDGFTIVEDLWKNSSEREKKHLQELIGAFDASSTTLSGTAANKYSEEIALRTKAGSGAHDGIQDFYCPLDFYFSAKYSPNRALDLSVLASPVILEVDMETKLNIFKAKTSSGVLDANLPSIANISAMCYLTELHPEVEKSYRALSYAAGGSPLTQLAFNSERVVVSTNLTHGTSDTVVDVKLNQFSGSVYKLVVYAVLTDNFPTNVHRIRPGALKEIQIKATGTNIVNQDNLHEKEALLESYHNGGDFKAVGESIDGVTAAAFTDTTQAVTGVSGSTGTATITDDLQSLIATASVNAAKGSQWDYNITCNPQNFYEISFKKPYDMSKVSASGSCAFGQLSVPSLRVSVAGSSGNGQFGKGANVLGAPVDIHVIAYSSSLMSYNTNSSGSTNVRMIAN